MNRTQNVADHAASFALANMTVCYYVTTDCVRIHHCVVVTNDATGRNVDDVIAIVTMAVRMTSSSHVIYTLYYERCPNTSSRDR